MSATTGILAALAAPLAMTLGFVIWDSFWKGSAFALNMYKCTVASFGFLLFSMVTRGVVRNEPLFPSDIFTAQNVGFLIFSSVIGILIGDWTWLEGLRLIGATRVIVIDACKPFLAALFGWTILGEALPPAAFGGMALTVIGVLVVSLEKERGTEESNSEGSSSIESQENSKGETEQKKGADDSDLCIEIVSEDGASSAENKETGTTDDTSSSSLANVSQSIDETPELDQCNTSQNDGDDGHKKSRRRRYRLGYSMAFLNVLLDTFASLLTKEYGQGMTTWEISLIRFGFAGASMLSLSAILQIRSYCQGKKNDTLNHKEDGEMTECGSVNHSCEKKSDRWYLLPTMKRRNWMKVSLGVFVCDVFMPRFEQLCALSNCTCIGANPGFSWAALCIATCMAYSKGKA